MSKTIEYWKLDKEELLRTYGSSETGLTEAESTRRLKEYGFNKIPHKGHRSTANILLSQFKSPMAYVLVFASVLSLLVGDVNDAAIIFAIMLINAMLGFSQEYRSEKALEELSKYTSYSAVVFRDGKKHVIDTTELVPGDIVYMTVGDVVPADIRLLETQEFQTNESELTGESTPVDKDVKPIDIQKPLPYQLSNTALMSTNVSNGSGTGLVVTTGAQTYYGQLASSLSVKAPITDFQKNMANLGSFLVKMVLVLTTFVFLVNAILARGIVESLIFALALAVGVMPEALPVIITVGLSSGALRLAKKKVVVKRLEAVEDIGNMDVLCTDKTGTLTQNRITVEDIVDPEGHSNPALIKYGLLCNTAVVEKDKILGNPIDVAIWDHARHEGFDEASLNDFKHICEIPFQFNRRRMSFVFEKDGHRLLISKGAPESILDVSTDVGTDIESKPISPVKGKINSLIQSYGQAGNRLIALAFKEVENKSDYSPADENGLTFIGLVVLTDPPKEDAANAISRLKSLMIKLKILSGDDPIVTANVCQKVGVDNQGKTITGMDIENEQESEIRLVVEESNVYGRITPDQKDEIVRALKKNGHVTGFLGDGVNDAPALKSADVGISVEDGVQVAKEASSIILLEKSLSVIADGVVEGRKAFGNMVKYIMNTISGNFSNMLTIAVSSVFLPFIPMLPSQILLTNLLTDAPLLAISSDNLDEESLRQPKRLNIGSLARFSLYFGVVGSAFDFAMIISLVYILHLSPELFRSAWFIFSVLSEIVVTFSIRTKRRFYESKPSNLLIASSIIFAVLTLIIVYSPIGSLFQLVQPSLSILALTFAMITAYFFIVELLKKFFFARHDF